MTIYVKHRSVKDRLSEQRRPKERFTGHRKAHDIDLFAGTCNNKRTIGQL
jgi:hypothetical protein